MQIAPALTGLLQAARNGDSEALPALFDSAYEHLRRLARKRLKYDARGVLLDTTSLVHEAYVRICRLQRIPAESTSHFMCYAARVMRSVVVDFARSDLAQRRGGGALHETLITAHLDSHAESHNGAIQILEVDAALLELASYGERLRELVEMRYFAGMTETQIALALHVTERTIRRDWNKARLLLRDILSNTL
jgi:RNA polymerase sigma factor (TIGR02999 family)